MSVTVRQAGPDDARAIASLAAEAWQAGHAPIVGESAVERFLAEHYDVDSIRDRIVEDRSVHPVAIETDSVQGFGYASPTADQPGLWALSQCYVIPERWGEGIGTALLAAIEERVRDRGADRLRLGVMAPNDRAIGFYEARGFERVGAFHDERLDVDGYRYAKDLE